MGKRKKLHKNFNYHSFEQVIAQLAQARDRKADISSLENIGYSLGKRPLQALKISDNLKSEGKRPAVLFISLIHGLEIIGLEVLMGLMNKLINDYQKNAYITYLVKNRDAWFIPVANPDAMAHRQRNNLNGVDLNRNFNVGFSNKGLLNKWTKWPFYPGTRAYSEPETEALKNFFGRYNFIFVPFISFFPRIN